MLHIQIVDLPLLGCIYGSTIRFETFNNDSYVSSFGYIMYLCIEGENQAMEGLKKGSLSDAYVLFSFNPFYVNSCGSSFNLSNVIVQVFWV